MCDCETVRSRRPPIDGPSMEAQRGLDHLVLVSRHGHHRGFPAAEGIHRERDTHVGDDDRERRSDQRVDPVLRCPTSLRVDLRERSFEDRSHGSDAETAFGGGVGSSRRRGAGTVTLLQQ